MVALTEGSAVIKWSSPAKNGSNVTSATSTFLSSTFFDFFRILLTNPTTDCIMVNDSSRKIFREVKYFTKSDIHCRHESVCFFIGIIKSGPASKEAGLAVYIWLFYKLFIILRSMR